MIKEVTLNRRGLLGAAAGTAAAGALGSLATPARALGADRKPHDGRGRLLPRGKIGIQLFTVRDQVSDLGFEDVFRELSDQGYSEVEFAGYSGAGRRWSNQELRSLLRKYHLKGIGSHVGYTSDDPNAYTFVTQLDQVLTDAEEIGLPYIGTASSPGDRFGNTVDGFKQAAEDFNTFGQAARDRGMRFYQHNHFSEFAVEDGTRLYDVLLEEIDPKLVVLELDIFWAYVGQGEFPGFKPHEYPWDQPERFPLFHVKDGIRDGGPADGWTMKDVGDGDIAFEPFFCGLDTDKHHFLMENDAAPDQPDGSFASAEVSYDYMAGLRERR